MRNRLIALLVLFTVVIFSSAQAQTTARKFEAGKNTFLLDGEPFVVKAAELHYTRIPQAYWEHRIEMCKALVAAEEKRCGASYARSLLYGARRHLYERSRQTIGATANK